MEEVPIQEPTMPPVIQTPLSIKPQPVKKPFFSKAIIVAFIIGVILILLPAGTYLFLNSNKQVACTTEAKICPDGSSVGRTGPKCEFTKCPTVTPTPDPASNAANATANWKTYVNSSFTFRYPSDWTVDGSGSINSPEKFGDEIEPLSYYVFIENLSNPTKLSFKDFVTKDLSQDLKNSFIYNTESLNNYTVYKTESLPSQSGCLQTYFTTDEIKYSEVALCPYDSKNPFEQQNKYLNIFNLILSTFKFTDQSSPTPTCQPRPACLDATPRCMIPETSDMCPKSNTLSPTPDGQNFTGNGCKIGGCSREICQNASDEPMTSICIYKASFACYKTARCEKQQDGICGWTQTSELISCLDENK